MKYIRNILVPLLIWSSLATATQAQSLGFSRGGDGPIQIEADDGIEWQRENQLYVARGNASAQQGTVTVEADELIAFYRPNAEGENEIFRIDANGNVRIVSNEEVARSDRAVYEVDKGILVLTGDKIQLDTAQDTIVARDSMEYYETQKLAIARGDALAIRGDRRVGADVLTAHFGEAGEQSEMNRIEALGNVLVSTPTDIVRADKGDYYPKRGFATVTGNVKITRGDTQLNGERAEVNLETGESRLLASPSGERVRGLFLPRAKTGGNPESTVNQ